LFFAQIGKPERAIPADLNASYTNSSERMGLENYADYQAAMHDPDTVHGTNKDYRAGLGIDRVDDERSRRRQQRVVSHIMFVVAPRRP
jgi:haloacetate dehalogenase